MLMHLKAITKRFSFRSTHLKALHCKPLFLKHSIFRVCPHQSVGSSVIMMAELNDMI